MTFHELHKHIKQAHAEGMSKNAIFEQFRQQGPSEKRVAQAIAMLPSQRLIQQYKTLHMITVIAILVIAMPLLIWGAYIHTQEVGVDDEIMYFFCGAVGLVFPLISAIGVYGHKIHSYTNFAMMGLLAMVLSILFLHQFHYPVTAMYVVAILLGGGLISLVLYTRTRLFPSLLLSGAIKTDRDGHFLFVD